MNEIKEICNRFFKIKSNYTISEIKGGLINSTYKISFERVSYILQAINTKVFKDPELVMDNIQNIANHLQKNDYPLKILKPISSARGILEKDKFGTFWRAFPFIENTTVFKNITYPNQAFEAAKSFGLFIKYLDGIDINSIKETIPNFHDLKYRKTLFDSALSRNKLNRKDKVKSEIEITLKWLKSLQFDFTKMPKRVVHNDAKISNVLLDKNGLSGVCVIDLDTVMPGYIVTDFGDMVRTMCCTVTEEETDFEKVAIDINIFKATAEGFLSITKSFITSAEKKNLFDGCAYIILEQAIRYLTDYLEGDIYYPNSFADQNLYRAKNQLKLLESLIENRLTFEQITTELH